MVRAIAACLIAVAACATAPDGLLVVTDGDLGDGHAATVDVYLGVDRGLPFAPLTATRALVLDALPDDLDRDWADTSRPYKVLLDVATDAELYVVLRGHATGDPEARRFGANLREPVAYPGAGLYQVTADLYTPGDRGVCPHGTAEDAGYEVELVDTAAGATTFDCDLDTVPYPEDCADYDTAIRPAPAYPASSGIETPDEMMCCNGDVRVPVEITAGSGGTGSCNLSIGCPGAPPQFTGAVTWTSSIGGFVGEFCECVATGHDPLDCMAGAHGVTIQGVEAGQPACNLAVDDSGSVCPGQTWTVRGAFGDFLAPTPTTCPVEIVWQAGAAALSFRSQGATETTLATTDCDADLVFDPAGPPPGQVAPNGGFGWYVISVRDTLIAMHAHPQPVIGCTAPTECHFE